MHSRLPALLLTLLMSAQLGATELDFTRVIWRELPRTLRLDGVVEAVNQSMISAQTSGRVVEVKFDVDDFVKQGDLILRLEDTEQRAGLTSAEAELKRATARRQEASDEYRRIKGIFERKLVSQSAMDKARAALKSAEAAFESAQAQLEQARQQLSYTRVTAPYAGIVTQRLVEIGEMASPGQRLMSGISLDQLRVLVDVPQSLVPAIRKIGDAGIQLPGNGYVTAKKMTIFPYASLDSHTFKVRLDLPAGIKGLFPGMFVKTAFLVDSRRQLVVPEKAIVTRSEVTGVYVLGESNRISLRHIRVGSSTEDGEKVVLAGLSADERIALDPIAAGAELKRQQAEAGQ